MANLGLRLSDQTVGNILRRHDIPPCGWRIVISLAAGHVTLLHSVLGLGRIELVVADSKSIGAG
jgi:hypothetical protein